MVGEIRIDFIPFDELRQRAERWLTQWHPSRDVPIPIESIIESGLEWNIVAVKGFKERAGAVACIKSDMTGIEVDEETITASPELYRFSLAHEVAHAVLHQRIFRWMGEREVNRLPADQAPDLEYQANTFASLILIPREQLKRYFACATEGFASCGLPVDRDEVVRRLKGEFAVSAQAMKYAIEREQLWSMEDQRENERTPRPRATARACSRSRAKRRPRGKRQLPARPEIL